MSKYLSAELDVNVEISAISAWINEILSTGKLITGCNDENLPCPWEDKVTKSVTRKAKHLM